MMRYSPFVILLVLLLLSVPASPQSISDYRADLALELLFDGDARDTSGNGHHGKVHWATPTADRFGRTNRAYDFDGLNAYIEIAPPPALSAEGFTLSVWAKYDEAGIYQWWSNAVISQDSGYMGAQRVFQLSAKGLLPYWHFMGRAQDLSTQYEITPDQWYHLVLTYDGTTHRMYLNGDLQSEREAPFTPNPHLPILVGTKGSFEGAFNFDGAIDDVRIYKRALDETAIRKLTSENGWVPPDPPVMSIADRSSLNMEQALVGHWPLERDPLEDMSGHNRDGALIGPPETVDGVIGAGLHFDRPWGFIKDPALELTHDLSLTFWVKGFDPTKNWYPVLWYGNSYISHYVVMLQNGKIGFRVYGKEAEWDVNVETPLPPETWTFVAVTMHTNTDGRLEQSIYINGKSAVENTTDAAYYTFDPKDMWFCLGANGPGFGPPTGVDLDELRIYRRALKPDEVAGLYDSP